MEIHNGTLAPKYREAGLQFVEDDHIAELKDDKGQTIAAFSAITVTAEEIHKEAEKWLREHKTK